MESTGWGKEQAHAEDHRQVRVDAPHRRRYASQRRLESAIAAQPFDVRCAKENEQKCWEKRGVDGDQRSERGIQQPRDVGGCGVPIATEQILCGMERRETQKETTRTTL